MEKVEVEKENWLLRITDKAPKGTFIQLTTVFRTGFDTPAKFDTPFFRFSMDRPSAQRLAISVQQMIEAGHVVGPYPEGGTEADSLHLSVKSSAKQVADARWKTVTTPTKPAPVDDGPIPKETPGNTPANLKAALENNPVLGDPTPIGPRGTPTPPAPPPIKDPNASIDPSSGLPPQVTYGSPGTKSTPIETKMPPGLDQVSYPKGHAPPAKATQAVEPVATGAHVSDLPVDGPSSAIIGPTANFVGDLAAAQGLDPYVYGKLEALKRRRVTEKNHREWVRVGEMSERAYHVRQVADLARGNGKFWLVERKWAPERELGRVQDWAAAIGLIEAEERSLIAPPAPTPTAPTPTNAPTPSAPVAVEAAAPVAPVAAEVPTPLALAEALVLSEIVAASVPEPTPEVRAAHNVEARLVHLENMVGQLSMHLKMLLDAHHKLGVSHHALMVDYKQLVKELSGEPESEGAAPEEPQIETENPTTA